MTYTVRARQWRHGWELHIDGVGVTQCRTLRGAEAMVRDYLHIDDYPDWETAEVEVVPELDGLEAKIQEARAASAAATAAQADAAAASRQVVKELRDKGVSVSDAAALLHVSRGRISQLVK